MKKLLFLLLAIPMWSQAQMLSAPVRPPQIGGAPDSNYYIGSDEFGRAIWKPKTGFTMDSSVLGTRFWIGQNFIKNNYTTPQTANFMINGLGQSIYERSGWGAQLYGSSGFNGGSIWHIDNGWDAGNPNLGHYQNGIQSFLHTYLDTSSLTRSFVSDADFSMASMVAHTRFGSRQNNGPIKMNFIDRGSFSSGGGLNGILSRVDFWSGGSENTIKIITGQVHAYTAALDIGSTDGLGGLGSSIENFDYYHAGGYRTYSGRMNNVVIGNLYGYRVSPLFGGATNRWGFYQEGTSDKNYFGGTVMIGSTVNDGNKLQVTGDAKVTGVISNGSGYDIRMNSNAGFYESIEFGFPSQASGANRGLKFTKSGGDYQLWVDGDHGTFNNYLQLGGSAGTDLFTGGSSIRLRIPHATGNVLINTTTDDSTNKLQVNGSAKLTRGLTLGVGPIGHSSNAGDSMLVRASDGIVKVLPIPAGGGGGGGTIEYTFSSEFSNLSNNISVNAISVDKITGVATVGKTGVYADLIGKPTLFSVAGGAAEGKVIKYISGVPTWADDNVGSGGGTTYNFSPTEFTLSGTNVSVNQIASTKITGLNAANWDAAYADRIVSAAVTGGSIKTITLTQQDGGTVTANFTDNEGSGGGGSGTVTTGAPFRLAYYAAATASVAPWSAITADKALVSNSDGMPVASSVTGTELNYLSGATSNLQAQIDAINAGEANTLASLGGGYSLNGGKSGTTLNLRSLVAGNNITMEYVDGSNSVRISAEPDLDPHYTKLLTDQSVSFTPSNLLTLDLPAGTWQVIGTGLFATPSGSNQSVSMELVANSSTWSAAVVHTQNTGGGSINESGNVSTLIDLAYPTTVILRVMSFGGSTALSTSRGTQLYAYRVGPSALAE